MQGKKYYLFVLLFSALLIVLLVFLVTSKSETASAEVDSSMVGYISTEAARSPLDLNAVRSSEAEVTETAETVPAETAETQEAAAETQEMTETAAESEAVTDTVPAPETEIASDTAAPETAAVPAATGQTVLIGDSRAYTFEYFSLYPAELVFWFMDQVDVHYSELDQAASLYPSKAIFLNGIDDLCVWGPPSETIGHYEAYITYFENHSPGTQIYVHSVLPVAERAYARHPQLMEIDAYNTLLADMCARHGWQFINCAENFDLSYLDDDGIHFYQSWAQIWMAQLRAAIGF